MFKNPRAFVAVVIVVASLIATIAINLYVDGRTTDIQKSNEQLRGRLSVLTSENAALIAERDRLKVIANDPMCGPKFNSKPEEK